LFLSADVTVNQMVAR